MWWFKMKARGFFLIKKSGGRRRDVICIRLEHIVTSFGIVLIESQSFLYSIIEYRYTRNNVIDDGTWHHRRET